jgi:hypothetical protein
VIHKGGYRAAFFYLSANTFIVFISILVCLKIVRGQDYFHDPEKGGLNNEASGSLRSPVSFIFSSSLNKQVCSSSEKIKAPMLCIEAS